MAGELILIAEDEGHIRLALSLILKQAGFRVLTAADGREALNRIVEGLNGSEPVALLITDIQMPRLDGLGLINELQRRGIVLPVIPITGYHNQELTAELSRGGCREYINKPFSPETIASRVKKVLLDTDGT